MSYELYRGDTNDGTSLLSKLDDAVLEVIGKHVGIDFSKQSLTLREIRHLLAQTKRRH